MWILVKFIQLHSKCTAYAWPNEFKNKHLKDFERSKKSKA